MTYTELLSASIVAIFFIIALLKEVFPWLGGAGSRYIPLFSLAMGIGVAVYASFHYDMSVFEIIVGAIIPMLASSGINSVKNTALNN